MRRVPAATVGPLLAALVVLAGCASVAGPAPVGGTVEPATVDVTVIDVIDGDTIEVRLSGGGTDTVRLLGVDTPEVHAANEPVEYEGVPDTEAGAACLRAAGHDATAFVQRQVLGAGATLVFDPAADRRGAYGRLLASVEVDGRDLNRRLVARGHARVYGSEFGRASAYAALEAEARAERRGLWRCRSPESTGGTATPAGDGPLRLVAVNADAGGDDRENLTGEYVVFEHAGNRTLDLSGWTVTDGAGHTYRFPDGFDVAPGARVALHTGAGDDTATRLYWGADGPVWNNGGDVVVVRTANGTVVLERSYG